MLGTYIAVPEGQQDDSSRYFHGCTDSDRLLKDEHIVYMVFPLTHSCRNSSAIPVEQKAYRDSKILLTQPTAKPRAGSTQRAAVKYVHQISRSAL